jgi:hypothetical protein
MIPHLPRPARAYTTAVGRTMRRLRKGVEPVGPEKVKRPTERPSQAFNAADLLVPPVIAANAASSSD